MSDFLLHLLHEYIFEKVIVSVDIPNKIEEEAKRKLNKQSSPTRYHRLDWLQEWPLNKLRYCEMKGENKINKSNIEFSPVLLKRAMKKTEEI